MNKSEDILSKYVSHTMVTSTVNGKEHKLKLYNEQSVRSMLSDMEVLEESYKSGYDCIKQMEEIVTKQHVYILELENKIETLQHINNELINTSKRTEY